MKADITRSTYNKNKKYVKVNAQQGKVQVDADWNEQIDIQEHLNQTSLTDIIGRTGAPIEDPGFEITVDGKEIYIGKGRFYVDGILCENGDRISARKQEDLPDNSNLPKLETPLNSYSALPNQGDGLYVIYLDVWQRHITSLEDPDLREVALGGADTTTRTKTVWQLKSWPVEQDMTEPSKPVNLTTQKGKNVKSTIEKRVLYQLETKNQALEKFEVWKKNSLSTGTLQVQVKPQVDANRCSPSPEAGYSGDENRLYRVEIHPGITGKSKAPLFKWSRENASVAARIINVKAGQKTTEKLLVIRNTGKDDRTRFGEGQWIELTDDYHELWNLPGRIVKIISAEEDTLENVSTLKVSDVGLDANDNESLLHFNPPDSSAQKDTYIPLNPKVRRWNIPDDKWSILGYSADPSAAESQQKPILTGTTSTFTDLEDNIQIKFSVNNYVPGDYWLIPARTITKSLEWPVTDQNGVKTPKEMPSLLEHHYCPLALVNSSKGILTLLYDYRDFFTPLARQLGILYVSGDGQELKQDTDKNVLPFDLVVGIAVGGHQLKKEDFKLWHPLVRFEVTSGKGTVASHDTDSNQKDTFTAEVDDNGLARCRWTLDSENIHQQVKATLVNETGLPTGMPVIFNGHLPVSFYYIRGDGQEITPLNVFKPKQQEVVAVAAVAKEETAPASNEVVPAKTETKDEATSENRRLMFESRKEEFYVIGKGEVSEKPTASDFTTRKMQPIMLTVGAKMGNTALESVPAGNFIVHFQIEDETSVGSLAALGESFEAQAARKRYLDIPLINGVASCNWAFAAILEPVLADGVSPGKQQVRATLVLQTKDKEINLTQLAPIYFNATFAQPTIHYVNGDGQEAQQAPSDFTVPEDIVVRVDAGDIPLPESMTPLWNVSVRFTAKLGSLGRATEGDITNVLLPIDNERGVVSCPWRLDTKRAIQTVAAFLVSSRGAALDGPVGFTARLPITFVYVSGDGLQVSTGGVINLQVQALLGGLPLAGYKVQFTTDKSATLEPSTPVTTNEEGIASCDWTIQALTDKKLLYSSVRHAQATLFGPQGKPTNLPPVYFNAAVSAPSAAAPATSGIVKLEFQENTDKNGPLISNAIEHSLNADIPPAVILSLMPPVNNDFAMNPIDPSKVEYLEDYALYNWALNAPKSESKNGAYPPFPRFKAVDVNTKNFRILIEPPYPQLNWLWYVRWWAIPAQAKEIQKATFESASLEPKLAIVNTKTLGDITTLNVSSPFAIAVEDHNIQTGSVAVNLKISAINYTRAITLSPLPAKDHIFYAIVTIFTNKIEVLNANGKVDSYSMPALKTSAVTVDYTYRLRQGFATGTLTAKANITAPTTAPPDYSMNIEATNLVEAMTHYTPHINEATYLQSVSNAANKTAQQ